MTLCIGLMITLAFFSLPFDGQIDNCPPGKLSVASVGFRFCDLKSLPHPAISSYPDCPALMFFLCALLWSLKSNWNLLPLSLLISFRFSPAVSSRETKTFQLFFQFYCSFLVFFFSFFLLRFAIRHSRLSRIHLVKFIQSFIHSFFFSSFILFMHLSFFSRNVFFYFLPFFTLCRYFFLSFFVNFFSFFSFVLWLWYILGYSTFLFYFFSAIFFVITYTSFFFSFLSMSFHFF